MSRRSLTFLLPLVLAALALPAGATWSIVIVNTRTREVGVASATCLEGFNLRSGVPVVWVGEGAAAAQSFLDVSADNRRLIFQSFRDTEETPEVILAALAAQDTGHQTRQYGIVNFTGDPVTFTGAQAGAAASGVTGRFEDFVYAVQGNVLVGDEVVLAAEQALRGTKGDMGEKLMAAMEAARALGGDGRCSCRENQPTSCGVPPPNFLKSAHVGFVIVARVGDENGLCNRIRGCATGDYHLALNVRDAAANDPDPVFTLQARYKIWRLERAGRPDGILSRVSSMGVKLPADGVTEQTIRVFLRDIDDVPLDHGGAQVTVGTVDGLPSLATVGPVTDHGDGSYSFTLRAGTEIGLDQFAIRAQDDLVAATLQPYFGVLSIEPQTLHAGVGELSASAGAHIPFVVHEPALPAAEFLLFARLAAPGPGRLESWRRGGARLLPLAQSPFFPSAPGLLDSAGRAALELEVPAGLWNALAGRRIEWTGSLRRGPALRATNTVAIEIVP